MLRKRLTLIYVPPNHKIANLDIFKRIVDTADQLMVFIEDGLRRSVRNKIEKLL